jgi:hypothetical protein
MILGYLFVHVQSISVHGGKTKTSPDHECKGGLMTTQDLLQHLRSEGDSTHTVISIYLVTLHTFCQGHVRQDPDVNSKQKPHSQEEEKEEEKEKKEEISTALDGNDISH